MLVNFIFFAWIYLVLLVTYKYLEDLLFKFYGTGTPTFEDRKYLNKSVNASLNICSNGTIKYVFRLSLKENLAEIRFNIKDFLLHNIFHLQGISSKHYLNYLLQY